MSHAVGVINGNWRDGMYFDREQEIKIDMLKETQGPSEVQALRAKETIREIMGNDFLQEWIKENFGLCGRVYRAALIALADQVQKKTADLTAAAEM